LSQLNIKQADLIGRTLIEEVSPDHFDS